MRSPSTFCEKSFNFRRLRTTPAKKPRTECCCQSVAFVIATIVVPAGDCSIAMTRDCFEAASAALLLDLAAVCWLGFATATGAAASDAERFFVDLDIEILAFGSAAKAPPPPKPHSAF